MDVDGCDCGGHDSGGDMSGGRCDHLGCHQFAVPECETRLQAEYRLWRGKSGGQGVFPREGEEEC